jgi:hypothetical protein
MTPPSSSSRPVTLVFGVTTRLGAVGNQTALYTQASNEQIGTTSGLLRTSTYLGTIVSSSLVGLSFGNTANDAGLHILSFALAGLSGLLLLTTAVSRRLPAHTPAPPTDPASGTACTSTQINNGKDYND